MAYNTSDMLVSSPLEASSVWPQQDYDDVVISISPWAASQSAAQARSPLLDQACSAQALGPYYPAHPPSATRWLQHSGTVQLASHDTESLARLREEAFRDLQRAVDEEGARFVAQMQWMESMPLDQLPGTHAAIPDSHNWWEVSDDDMDEGDYIGEDDDLMEELTLCLGADLTTKDYSAYADFERNLLMSRECGNSWSNDDYQDYGVLF
ncbi:uncharacterized protein BJ171DRAFT_495688 [Polychytrium aggregatum]|uniref:uncharacterized protein n=1 Tax=Polychytrium aggregatum TaxID=110093 RepID=UPI0022FF2783|nr:uncharacterized protein BJ171DRAFT_495688 [Polychytrium aggregatum]KAI9207116.1 hypothetical protein BJ171DRAFT_495688 [Polychytrium aggregatum]